MLRGLILFAHGARDPEWGRPLRDLAQRIHTRDPLIAVRVAYLELQPPDLLAAIAELVPPCSRIGILPVFWAAAGHVTKDLPALLETARVRHRDLRLHVLPTLAELPGALDFLADVAVALTHGDSTASPAG